ncbi:hypothetical protein [Halomonas sp. SL1]|uniref:hypothetical protein n=1 Tax=Halomonas sp. SL1 TaxID=2137478 RepID=UPI000D1682D3|nr:hypothetical protein [Halomonas sp. SL1]RAH37443.1 hypothetical protein C9J49_011110 [Halomonas sp. SL1]
MKLKHLLHPIRSARRLEELEDRVRELEITLRDDHQWLAHDPIARANRIEHHAAQPAREAS